MSEFDDKLNALLSNPDSMAQIMQLAQSLSGGQTPPATGPQQSGPAGPPPGPPPAAWQPPAPPPSQPPVYTPAPPNPGGSGLSGLLGGLGLDPQLLSRLLPLVQELNSPADSNARTLLYALRPYLKPQRQEKVEKALQLARLLRLGRKFLSGGGGMGRV